MYNVYSVTTNNIFELTFSKQHIKHPVGFCVLVIMCKTEQLFHHPEAKQTVRWRTHFHLWLPRIKQEIVPWKIPC